MKKITLLFALLITSIGFSQTELITNGDFENGDASWVGTGDFSVVAGEAYFSTTNAAGDPWSTQLVQANMTFVNAQEYVLKFKARAAADRKMTVAIQNVNDWDDQFRQEYDLTTTMTEYTATFNAARDFGNVQIGFLMAASGSTEAIYIDDVSIVTSGTTADPTCTDGIQNGDETGVDCGGSCNACPSDPEPTDAPTTPPSFDAQNVISFYGEAHTPTGGLNDVTWDEGATSEEITVAGNKILKIKAGNFIGFDIGQYVDASSMTHLHMDYWIGDDWTDGQVLNPKLSNHAAQNGETNGLDIGNPITGQEQVKNWQSKDFALNGDRASLKEFLITVAGRSSVFYIDNVYLFVEGTASVENNALLGFSMYPNPASNRLNISAKETIQRADVFNVLGKRVMSIDVNKTNASLDISNLTSGMYLVKYDVSGTTGTAKFIKQ